MRETVLITGANRGLGLALANKFGGEDWQVLAGARADHGGLADLVKRFPHVSVVSLDVTDVDSVRNAARQVSERATGLDILINNAAIFPEEGTPPLAKLDLSDMHLQRTMDVNVLGPLRVTQQFLPLLERGQRKLILNVSSEAGSIADCRRKSQYAYCMSKAALNMQSRILQNDLGRKGFKVLAVHPGWMQTDMGGPDATVPPDVSAAGIFRLAMRHWDPSDEIYWDYRGNSLRW